MATCRPVVRGHHGEKDASFPRVRRRCISGCSRCRVFLIYPDPNVSVIGHGMRPSLIEHSGYSVGGMGKISGAFQAGEGRDEQGG